MEKEESVKTKKETKSKELTKKEEVINVSKKYYKKLNTFVSKNVGGCVVGIILIAIIIAAFNSISNYLSFQGTWEGSNYEIEISGSDCEIYYYGYEDEDATCKIEGDTILIESRGSDSVSFGFIIDGELVISSGTLLKED